MAYTVTLPQFARKIRGLGNDLERATIRGLRSAAMRLESFIIEEIDAAGAVATSELKASVDTEPTELGAITGADAPHAPFIEFGTRPHMPPIQPIEDWVRIKGLASDDEEVEEIAMDIAWTIYKYGTEPRFFLKKAIKRWKRAKIIDEEIADELRALERRRA